MSRQSPLSGPVDNNLHILYMCEKCFVVLLYVALTNG